MTNHMNLHILITTIIFMLYYYYQYSLILYCVLINTISILFVGIVINTFHCCTFTTMNVINKCLELELDFKCYGFAGHHTLRVHMQK